MLTRWILLWLIFFRPFFVHSFSVWQCRCSIFSCNNLKNCVDIILYRFSFLLAHAAISNDWVNWCKSTHHSFRCNILFCLLVFLQYVFNSWVGYNVFKWNPIVHSLKQKGNPTNWLLRKRIRSRWRGRRKRKGKMKRDKMQSNRAHFLFAIFPLFLLQLTTCWW